MGMLSSVEGRIEISPHLPWAKFRELHATAPGLNVRFEVHRETVDTEEGTLEVKKAVAIVPRYDDEYKAYYLLEHVQRLVDVCRGHQLSGYLEEVTEEHQLSRIYVVDGKAVEVRPEIVWPDPSRL